MKNMGRAVFLEWNDFEHNFANFVCEKFNLESPERVYIGRDDDMLEIFLSCLGESHKDQIISFQTNNGVAKEDADMEWDAAKTHDGSYSFSIYPPLSTTLFAEFLSTSEKIDFPIHSTHCTFDGVYAFEN